MRKIEITNKANSNSARRGKRRGKLVVLGVLLLLALFLLTCAGYGIKSFFEKYRVQSPVVFRPVVVKQQPNKKHAPRPRQPRSKGNQTKKRIIPQVEASEPVIESFPKYLTDQGDINRTHVLSYMEQQGYNQNNIVAMDNIFKKESGYRADALNEIGAGGICQAYPYTKMGCELTTEDLMCQVDWCLNYVNVRYGSPVEAWDFHIINNWF